MGIELLCALLLQAKYDLDGCWALRDLERLANHGTGGVFKNMRGDVLLVGLSFGDTTLVAAHELKHVERARIDHAATVGYNADYDLLQGLGGYQKGS